MKKSEADKIAQKIANDWKLFWMSQTQNSKQDYDNYFRRALAVDANMRAHLESLISAALVDASNATKESQSAECVHSWKLEANQYVCMKCNLLNSIAEYRGKEKVTECAEFDESLDELANEHENHVYRMESYKETTHADSFKFGFLAGQKSKALKLPDNAKIREYINSGNKWGLNYYANEKAGFAYSHGLEIGIGWLTSEIKSLNEGK